MSPEDEKNIIEAMARAMCEADGVAPDELVPYFQGNVETGASVLAWQNYEKAARRQYLAHLAMLFAMGD